MVFHPPLLSSEGWLEKGYSPLRKWEAKDGSSSLQYSLISSSWLETNEIGADKSGNAWSSYCCGGILNISQNPKWVCMSVCMQAAAAAKSLQSCPTLCDPIDGSPPGSPVPGILQARTLEWVAISFSNAWKLKTRVKSLSHVWFLVTPWTAAYQAPPSMRFSRQEYWSGVPLPSPVCKLE